MGCNFHNVSKDQIKKALYLLYDIEDEIEFTEEEEVLYSIAELCVNEILHLTESGRYNLNTEIFNNIPDLIPLPDDVPLQCRTCPQHPYNGGSGICHCTLGSAEIQ